MNLELLSTSIVELAIRISLGLLLLWLGSKAISKLARFIKRLIFGRIADSTISSFLYSSVSISLRILLILAVLSIWGVQTTTFIAAFGAFSLAIGLALQGSMSNVASGVLLLLLKPFVVGEFIEVQQWSGTVKKIELFFTTIATVDNKSVVIPNSLLTTQVVTNLSRHKERRIDVSFQVLLDSDLEGAKHALATVIAADDALLKEDKTAQVVITDQSQGIATLTIRGWVNRADVISTKERLAMQGLEALKHAKVKLPPPLPSQTTQA